MGKLIIYTFLLFMLLSRASADLVRVSCDNDPSADMAVLLSVPKDKLAVAFYTNSGSTSPDCEDLHTMFEAAATNHGDHFIALEVAADSCAPNKFTPVKIPSIVFIKNDKQLTVLKHIDSDFANIENEINRWI